MSFTSMQLVFELLHAERHLRLLTACHLYLVMRLALSRTRLLLQTTLDIELQLVQCFHIQCFNVDFDILTVLSAKRHGLFNNLQYLAVLARGELVDVHAQCALLFKCHLTLIVMCRKRSCSITSSFSNTTYIISIRQSKC